jgi:hypothetical protein
MSAKTRERTAARKVLTQQRPDAGHAICGMVPGGCDPGKRLHEIERCLRCRLARHEIPEADNLREDFQTEFVTLVRAGEFVRAMERVQGHDRFNWFFALLDKVSTWLLCRGKNGARRS